MEHTTIPTNSGSINAMNDETRGEIEKLIQYNVDSSQGFEEAAQSIDQNRYKRLFQDIANDRKEFAARLKRECVQACGDTNYDDMPQSRSMKATLHQWWLKIKAGMTSEELESVLSSAEEGEDHIKAAYEEALESENIQPRFKQLIREQYTAVKRQHDLVRDLRDQEKAH